MKWVAGFLFLGVVVAVGLAGIGYFLTTPPSTNAEPVAFEISPGESVISIAGRLHQAGLIRSPQLFKAYVAATKIAPTLQAGSFTLSPSMPLSTLADSLTKARAESIKATILPGWRREEVAEALAAAFAAAGAPFDPDIFLDLPQTQEGYLFPDTYEFRLTASEADVALVIARHFEQQRARLEPAIQASGKSVEELLIMASIVERETRVDRALVAGILWKRLENGWPLEVDASLQYIKGYDARSKTWWPVPYAADKQLESPYNTYKYGGLPPGPIANPAYSALEAAANPEESEYWFYLTDRSGQMRYAKDYPEHLVNINRYLR